MNYIKKTTLFLGTMTTIAAPTIAIVSCSENNTDTTKQKQNSNKIISLFKKALPNKMGEIFSEILSNGVKATVIKHGGEDKLITEALAKNDKNYHPLIKKFLFTGFDWKSSSTNPVAQGFLEAMGITKAVDVDALTPMMSGVLFSKINDFDVNSDTNLKAHNKIKYQTMSTMRLINLEMVFGKYFAANNYAPTKSDREKLFKELKMIFLTDAKKAKAVLTSTNEKNWLQAFAMIRSIDRGTTKFVEQFRKYEYGNLTEKSKGHFDEIKNDALQKIAFFISKISKPSYDWNSFAFNNNKSKVPAQHWTNSKSRYEHFLGTKHPDNRGEIKKKGLTQYLADLKSKKDSLTIKVNDSKQYLEFLKIHKHERTMFAQEMDEIPLNSLGNGLFKPKTEIQLYENLIYIQRVWANMLKNRASLINSMSIGLLNPNTWAPITGFVMPEFIKSPQIAQFVKLDLSKIVPLLFHILNKGMPKEGIDKKTMDTIVTTLTQALK